MQLDAGWAGIIGAALGFAATIGGNIVTHWLSGRRANGLAEKRRARLRELLMDPKYQFRSMNTLSASIGASVDATAELLIEMDCRTSDSDRSAWGLISRNPRAQ